jgi:hypothetical protein
LSLSERVTPDRWIRRAGSLAAKDRSGLRLEVAYDPLDAVVVVAAFAALVVLGTKPFGLDDPASISGTAVTVAVILGLAVVCFLNGRVIRGVVGLFVLEEASARFDPSRPAGREDESQGGASAHGGRHLMRLTQVASGSDGARVHVLPSCNGHHRLPNLWGA